MEHIKGLYEGRVLRIPDYQREYSWGKSQREDFWDDLYYLKLKPAQDHHMGTLTLDPIPNDKVTELLGNDSVLVNWQGRKPYRIVDGQQRLTTVMILLCSLIDKYENDKKMPDPVIINGDTPEVVKDKYVRWMNAETHEFCYLFDHEISGHSDSRACLHAEIFPEHQKVAYTQTAYTQKLKKAKDFFDAKIKNFDKAAMDTLFNNLVFHLKFNIDDLGSVSNFDAYAIFEVRNNRGKPLSKLEILKNRLMYLAEKLNSPNTQVKINDTWAEIYKQLGRKDPILDDDKFLDAHWQMFSNTNRGNIKYLFEDKFTVKRTRDGANKPLTNKEIDEYVDSLKEAAESWYNLNFPDSLPDKTEAYWLNRLNRLGMSYFTPIILSMLVTSWATTAETRVEIYKAIEMFRFTNNIGKRRSDFREATFESTAFELYINQLSVTDLLLQVQFELNNSKPRSIYGFIDNYSADHQFSDSLSKYILQEYEYELRQSSTVNVPDKRNIFETASNGVKSNFSLEHIFPQNKPLHSYPTFANLDKTAQKIYMTCIGNLLVIPKKLNSSLQDKSFADKKNSYSTGGVAEREVAVNADWTPDTIKQRSEILLTFINNHWKLGLTPEQINNLLP